MHPPLAAQDHPARRGESTDYVNGFAAALSVGLDNAGLTLKQVQRKLRAHGVSVSLSTLSYWRRGQTRPERPDSMRAVHTLEVLLGLGPGHLVSLLGPRKPRGRWTARANLRSREALWDGTGHIRQALSGFQESPPGAITFLSLHEHHRLDALRRDHVTHVRAAIRAETDDVRSVVVLHRARSFDAALPMITSTGGCEVVRRQALPEQRTVITQLSLGGRLRNEETAALSYDITWFDQEPSNGFYSGHRYHTRSYLLQLSFHPGTAPARCSAFRQLSAQAPEIFTGSIPVTDFGTAHLFAESPEEAILGMHWRW